MRNRFDRQLEELNEMLIHMGELCETAIEEATGALEGHDIARAKAVITADSEIDQMEKEIEKNVKKLLTDAGIDDRISLASAVRTQRTQSTTYGEISKWS